MTFLDAIRISSSVPYHRNATTGGFKVIIVEKVNFHPLVFGAKGFVLPEVVRHCLGPPFHRAQHYHTRKHLSFPIWHGLAKQQIFADAGKVIHLLPGDGLWPEKCHIGRLWQFATSRRIGRVAAFLDATVIPNGKFGNLFGVRVIVFHNFSQHARICHLKAAVARLNRFFVLTTTTASSSIQEIDVTTHTHHAMAKSTCSPSLFSLLAL
mmetsp:Transcript_12704/g.26344  ORF Transcript_12704/g.26344 Transcript_12704/m.26344 type:complete len:209 (+) Transcript_12704:1088-1714(+)